MKHYLIVLVIILSGIFFAACNPPNNAIKKKYFNLTVICDSSFRYDLFSAVNLANTADTLKFNKIDYNSTSKTTKFFWDSIKAGEYMVHVKSIFSHEQIKQFTLTKNTTLKLSNNIEFKTVHFIPVKDLTNADTIEFAYRGNGCSFHFENYMLVKNNSDYTLTGTYKNNGTPVHISKKVSPTIISDLFTLQRKSVKYVDEALRNNSGGCTMRYEFYLLAGKDLFLCDDQCTDCPYFYQFKEKFIDSSL